MPSLLNKHSHLKYRPDIDGLRALAVVPVILFHAGFQTFSGGFIGVDVFFVISGYLITSIILAELEQGKFSIVNFYERRARRILPALFFVMLCCLPFAWFLILPSKFVEFSHSLIAVSLFVSNILFWLESGYFANASSEKPLLHTWSLAVEEQYYLLFPVFLYLLWKYRKNWIALAIFSIAVVSFVMAQYLSYTKPIAAFYLLPTRAWELMVGAFVACYYTDHNITRFGYAYSKFISFFGFLLIASCIFVYDKNTPFPSFYTLIPTFGTALIIAFNTKETLVSRVLGSRFFVGIGLISYSAYLWHQPLLAYAKLKSNHELSLDISCLLVASTFILAYLSWRFVERPFRNRHVFNKAQVFTVSGAGILLFSIVALLGHLNNGFPSRLTFESDANVSVADMQSVADHLGFGSYPVPKSMYKDETTGLMRMGKNDISNVLLIGDSHSDQYWGAFDEFFLNDNDANHKKSLLIQNLPFLPSIENLKLAKNTDTVVISYFWSLHYGSETVNQYIRCCGDGPNGVVGFQSTPSSPQQMNTIDDKLKDLISALNKRSIRVVIVLDNPFGEELNAQSMLKVDGIFIKPTTRFTSLSTDIAIARTEPVRSRLIKIANDLGARVIDPVEYLCINSVCPALSDKGYMLYKDYDHISARASKEDASFILKVLD